MRVALTLLAIPLLAGGAVHAQSPNWTGFGGGNTVGGVGGFTPPAPASPAIMPGANAGTANGPTGLPPGWDSPPQPVHPLVAIPPEPATNSAAALPPGWGSAHQPVQSPAASPPPPATNSATALPPGWGSTQSPAAAPATPATSDLTALPPGWGGGQQAQTPAQNAGTPINLVGRWEYQTKEDGVPEDVMIAFLPDGRYRQFIRFPNTPQLGRQIVQIDGTYQLDGANMLNIAPASASVLNGISPTQLCGLTTQKCITPTLTPNRFQLTQIDANTVQTPLGPARRVP